MARVSESPWTLRMAAIGWLATILIPVQAGAPTRPFVGAVVVFCLLLFFVLSGSRVAWVIALLFMGAGVVGTVVNGSFWEVAARVLVLALILLPASLAFVWQPKAP